jgi:hypothetical protein
MPNSSNNPSDNFMKYLLKEEIPIRGYHGDTPWYIISEKITIKGYEYYLCKDSDVEIWNIFRVENFESRNGQIRVSSRFGVKDTNVDQRRNFESFEQLLEYVASFK